MPLPLTTRAPAKINLTLHVLGRRADGYHELESLVAFAGTGDTLSLAPAPALDLTVEGPTAGLAGSHADNLVLKAARLLAERVPGLRMGAFHLVKRLPVAAGIGGGSSDAAGALRLLARLNGLPLAHPAVFEAARLTGADVPVCLDPRARMMRGIGEVLGEPLGLPRLFAVLVNPARAGGNARSVQGAGPEAGGEFGRRSASSVCRRGPYECVGCCPQRPRTACPCRAAPRRRSARPARRNRGLPAARMSGSGATVFALYDDCEASPPPRRRCSARGRNGG
jgi:4-diphosphocytidyl-2-C-methyl-D-erythritol kinase